MSPDQNNEPSKEQDNNTPAHHTSAGSGFSATQVDTPQPEVEVPSVAPDAPQPFATPAAFPETSHNEAPIQPIQAFHGSTTTVEETATTDVSDLTLYLVVLFSGLSVIASASYLFWSILEYFTSEPAYSFFDLSTFNIYVLIYLVLFGTLNVLASMRLDKKLTTAGVASGALKTVGALWRALLLVWGVSAFVGLLYAPLSASVSGSGEAGTIAKDVASAIFALALIALFFWRDVLLQKFRSGVIPTIAITALVVLVAGLGAYTTLSPKEASAPTTDYDYSDYNFDSSDSDYNSSESVD